MKYLPAFDIWATPAELLKHVQPGQWIYAGSKDHRGRFLGVKRSGTIVVAWSENAKRSGGIRGYYRALRHYAKGINREF